MSEVTIKDIKKWIEIDLKYGRTYDTPSLRYTGNRGIPVFLYDDLSSEETLKSILSFVSYKDNVAVTHPSAVTVGDFVPMYNLSNASGYYNAYCLEEHEDLDFLSVPDYTKGKALPIRGKLIHVSLEAMNELDMYYENEKDFYRTMIKVNPSIYYENPMWAWAYFNDVDQVATFDTKTSEYVVDPSIDLTTFRVIDDNWKEKGFYSF